jgi:hypothetical protein
MNNERTIHGIASWQEARDEIIMHVYILSIVQLLACSLITSWLARIAFFLLYQDWIWSSRKLKL